MTENSITYSLFDQSSIAQKLQQNSLTATVSCAIYTYTPATTLTALPTENRISTKYKLHLILSSPRNCASTVQLSGTHLHSASQALVVALLYHVLCHTGILLIVHSVFVAVIFTCVKHLQRTRVKLICFSTTLFKLHACK